MDSLPVRPWAFLGAGPAPGAVGMPDGVANSLASLPLPNNTTPHTRSPSRAPRREETKDSEKAGRVWARSVDDPWWPTILTCDGGGIRGYSTLIILQELMHEVWKWEQYYDELEADGESIRAESPVEYLDGRSGGQLQEEERGRGGYDDRPESPDSDEEKEDEEKEDDDEKQSFRTAAPSMVDTMQRDALTSSATTRKARTEEELLPCHYFDFMYGTSTGGLIATILGRLRMTVSEGLELYRKVGNDLFGKRRSSIPLMTKYYHEPLEAAVREIVAQRCKIHEHCNGNDLHPWEPDTGEAFDVDAPRVCQSAVLTATHDGNLTEAYLLRSYPQYYTDRTPNWITRYNEGADPLPIWTVTRATSAAPFYFEMVAATLPDGSTRLFKDGGIRENNPSGAAFSEFHALYADKAPHPALLLSLGTGLPNRVHDGFAPPTALPSPLNRIHALGKLLENLAVFQNVLIKYTEGEHQHVATRNSAHGEFTWYKRLNAEGLETLPLDDWRADDAGVPGGRSLREMEEATRKYLRREYDDRVDSYARPSVMLRQAAQKLVLQRRAREREGGERWEVFVGRGRERRGEEMDGNAH